ncbi:MAG: GNAT family N-acetyltransferase [Candidatus Marinimicrobia bacterium]|nr:GNAT family N-acetyltransferase [Candidatus Neomarinimicrobiota bacterium]
MNVTINPVSYSNSSDRKILQACLQNWFRNPKDLQFTDPRMSYPFDFRKWCALSYTEENVKTFVIKKDKWIVAYLSVKIVNEYEFAHLFHLFVDQEHRQLGLAKMLIEHAIEMAQKLKLKYISLRVSPKNERGILIYKTAGFEENGVTTQGNIKMRKEI